MAKTRATPRPAVVVICGDDEMQKSAALTRRLDGLLPPEVDRGLALTEYDGKRAEHDGGPALAAVLDDLQTLPFLSPLRVVLIRDAETFISAHREALERYVANPSPHGVLIMAVKSFPKTTRLYKAAAEVGLIEECKKPNDEQLAGRLMAEARARGKRLDQSVAARIVALIGREPGILATELEKLCVYVGDRPTITDEDVSLLVGESVEEAVFKAMDAAAVGDFPRAVDRWRQTLASNPDAVFMAVGGIAWKLRQWIAAGHMLASGMRLEAVAPKTGFWSNPQDLRRLAQRVPLPRLRRTLAALAELDAESKVGARSIERGVEEILCEIAR